MIMNKTIFEENWKLFRTQATGWWSLMAEYDLIKVDKAEVKFDKFVTMLQVKYGYPVKKLVRKSAGIGGNMKRKPNTIIWRMKQETHKREPAKAKRKTVSDITSTRPFCF